MYFSKNSEIEGDYGTAEPRVTAQMFLQGHSAKVTVLMGQSGSGKSLLMSTLGQQWAHGRVSFHHSHYLLTIRMLSGTLDCSVLIFLVGVDLHTQIHCGTQILLVTMGSFKMSAVMLVVVRVA